MGEGLPPPQIQFFPSLKELQVAQFGLFPLTAYLTDLSTIMTISLDKVKSAVTKNIIWQDKIYNDVMKNHICVNVPAALQIASQKQG